MTAPENSIDLEALEAITAQAAAQTAGVTGGSDPKLWLQALELITLDWLAPLRSELGRRLSARRIGCPQADPKGS